MRPADLLTIVHVTSDTILFRIRTYEHEAMWGKALTSYDLHSTLPEVTRHVGIVEVINKSRISDTGLIRRFATYSCSCNVASSVVMSSLPVIPTGPAELWSEQHPCHLHEGSGE